MRQPVRDLYPVVLRISIHAPRERSDGKKEDTSAAKIRISIHAPRERCDELAAMAYLLGRISIHAPRERCDPRSAVTAA